MAKLPEKASDPINCPLGGKHEPRGAEMKVDGHSVKFEKCNKCANRIGDRKS